jgi:ribosomal protein S18 acetylase RimI-like enzyme
VNSTSALAPALNRLHIRAAREDDLAAALALLEWEKGKNPWLDRTDEIVRDAISNPKSEYSLCVAERDGEIVGLCAYGIVAGAVGTGAIHAVLVAPRSRRAGIGHRLLAFSIDDLANRRVRVVFAELPGDSHLVRYRALLISQGFLEETRIDDFYRDGIPQIISRLDL